MDIEELKNMIKQNKEEAIYFTKEYIKIYLISLLRNLEEKPHRKTLLEKIKEYWDITKEENNYLQFIIENIYQITNLQSLDNILYKIDVLNEMTYKYYEDILKEYEEAPFPLDKNYKITPYKEFKTLIERNDLYQEIIGLLLTKEDLEIYYHNEEAFAYLKENSKVLETNEVDGMPYYGCYPIEEQGVLKKIKICVPPINDLKSMLINIHEYKHGISLYPYIGKTIPFNDYEEIAKKEEEQFIKVYFKRHSS